MEEVRVLAEAVAIPANVAHEVLAVLFALLPAVYAVEGRSGLQFLEYELIVLYYPRHVLDAHRPIQRVVTVEARLEAQAR